MAEATFTGVRQPRGLGRIVELGLGAMSTQAQQGSKQGTVAEIRWRTELRVLRRLLVARRFFAPVLLGVVAWIGLSDDALWRQIVLGVAGLALVSVIIHDAVLARQIGREGRIGRGKLIPNIAAVSVIQHAVIFSTGGLLSPVLPLILPFTFLTGTFARRRQAMALTLGLHLPMFAIDALLESADLVELTPTLFRNTSLGAFEPAPSLLIAIAITMSMAVLVATHMSITASAGLDTVLGDALRARDAALASRAAQARELTSLSGEIAHELKNPLASVKGLAALVHRELERQGPGPSQKPAERMAVLRREVDRMQGVLDEFLNFSRPLVPLSQRELELRELVDHVVDLHEGVADEREIGFAVEGRARLRCDPRKVEQIMINLVQNALEIAPAGSRVELEIGAAPGQVQLIVRDRGPGIDPELGARVFEAGVTGKAEGSGLGLTIARSLARQHGGELELGERGDGRSGCEARLSLPRAGLGELASADARPGERDEDPTPAGDEDEPADAPLGGAA